MIPKDWIIDADSSDEVNFCFYPLDEQDGVVYGLSYFGPVCPGNLVGVVHAGGPAKAIEFIEANLERIQRAENKAEEN